MQVLYGFTALALVIGLQCHSNMTEWKCFNSQRDLSSTGESKKITKQISMWQMRPSDEEGEYDNSMFGGRVQPVWCRGPRSCESITLSSADWWGAVCGPRWPCAPQPANKGEALGRPSTPANTAPHSARHPHSEQGQGETGSEGKSFEGKDDHVFYVYVRNICMRVFLLWLKLKELLHFVPQLSVLCEFVIRNKQNQNKIWFCL